MNQGLRPSVTIGYNFPDGCPSKVALYTRFRKIVAFPGHYLGISRPLSGHIPGPVGRMCLLAFSG